MVRRLLALLTVGSLEVTDAYDFHELSKAFRYDSADQGKNWDKYVGDAMPSWNGSVFTWQKRILFVGEAARSELHHSHTLMICIACNGKFNLRLSQGGIWQSFTAAIIDAGTRHRIDGREADFVALIHLLPDTEESRKLRLEYLANGGVYGVPAGPAKKLSGQLEELKNYWLLDCKSAAKFCDQTIGEFIPKPSARLDRQINSHVRRAIDELYSRMDQRLANGQSDKDFFTPSSVAAALQLGDLGWEGIHLKNEFKSNTGASYNDYVKLLRLRATMVYLALDQAKLKAALKQSKVGRAKGRRLMKLSLTAAAKSLGWGKPYNLSRGSIKILGISPSSLTTESRFLTCSESRSR